MIYGDVSGFGGECEWGWEWVNRVLVLVARSKMRRKIFANLHFRIFQSFLARIGSRGCPVFVAF